MNQGLAAVGAAGPCASAEATAATTAAPAKAKPNTLRDDIGSSLETVDIVAPAARKTFRAPQLIGSIGSKPRAPQCGLAHRRLLLARGGGGLPLRRDGLLAAAWQR